jgi:hypothetical protein
MDINRALGTVFRMMIGPLTNIGIDFLARRGKAEEDMTPEERQQAHDARQLAKRAKKMARITRRLGR